MIICHPFSSGISGQFIGTIGTIGAISGGGDGGTTTFGTFLFHTTGNGVLVAFGN